MLFGEFVRQRRKNLKPQGGFIHVASKGVCADAGSIAENRRKCKAWRVRHLYGACRPETAAVPGNCASGPAFGEARERQDQATRRKPPKGPGHARKTDARCGDEKGDGGSFARLRFREGGHG
ncbi:hypothetical protein ACVJMZ_003884 [Sinorhizobium medicae]